ncbi:MAG: hypothetical protein Q4E73_00400 [Lachnospiraceae bacterium]|nr:hypothetical protein [Lachnospiraceae bacterium]
MKLYQKILLIIGTVLAILFILYGIPVLSDMLEPVLGFDPRFVMYLLCILLLFVTGRVQGGGEYSKLNRRLRELDRELIQNHRIDYYIIQNKNLYKETKDPKYRAIIMTNIATAYHHDGKYDKSNNVITKINLDSLSENQKATIFNQQFLNYVNMRQTDQAAAIYEAHKDLFEKYEKNKEYRNHYLVSRLSYELAVAANDQDAIKKIREEFDSIRIAEKAYPKAYHYRLLEGKLLIAEGNGKEGRENLRSLQKENLMPGMKREVARAIKY